MFIVNDTVIEDLWLNDKSIAYFICNNRRYWVLDYKYQYQLDQEIEAKSLLDKGQITLDIFNSGLENSRGGISRLKKYNFNKYLELQETIVLEETDLKKIITYDLSPINLNEIYLKIENYLSFGEEISDNNLIKINEIKSRLPRYYINFDRQIYLHTDYDLSPETSVSYSNWIATDSDFSYYIPSSDTYWIIENKNFWKTMYL